MEGLDEVFDNLNADDGPVIEQAEAPQSVEAAPVEVETPEPVIEPAPAIEAPVEREDKSVPLATFLDMRDKLKEAERRAAELEAAKPQQPQNAPDPYDDPQGYAAYQSQQVQAAVLANKFEMSDVIARQAHGAEAVEAATTWAAERAKSNPAFAAEYMREAHPIDWIVRQHKRDGLLSQIGEDPDEFVKRRAAELGLIATAPAVPVTPAPQQQVPQPKAPPKSLVNAPSHGGVSEVPTGRLAGMDTVFPR